MRADDTSLSGCLSAISMDMAQNGRFWSLRRTLTSCVIASMLVALLFFAQTWSLGGWKDGDGYLAVKYRKGMNRALLKEGRDSKDSGSGKSPRKRVALAFYGLTRSLKYTIDSIETNVLYELELAGYDYDIYLHTYSLKQLVNSRTFESSELNTTEWKLLKPDFVEIASQEEFLEDYALPIDGCINHKRQGESSFSSVDYYDDNFTSVHNLMCQLNSLSQITRMWRATHRDYHAVIYLRPDVLFNCPFPIQALDTLRDNTLYIADFHHWHGYNDRFAMGTPATAALWGDRLNFVLATCMQHQIHAEMTVSRLLEHHQLQAQMVKFNFFRVRANGLLSDKDYGGAFEISTCDHDMIRPFEQRRRELGIPINDKSGRPNVRSQQRVTTTGRRRETREESVDSA